MSGAQRAQVRLEQVGHHDNTKLPGTGGERIGGRPGYRLRELLEPRLRPALRVERLEGQLGEAHKFRSVRRRDLKRPRAARDVCCLVGAGTLLNQSDLRRVCSSV